MSNTKQPSAWSSFWSAFATLFRGVDQYAQAFEESGKLANESVGSYADEVRKDRQKILQEMEKES